MRCEAVPANAAVAAERGIRGSAADGGDSPRDVGVAAGDLKRTRSGWSDADVSPETVQPESQLRHGLPSPNPASLLSCSSISTSSPLPGDGNATASEVSQQLAEADFDNPAWW